MITLKESGSIHAAGLTSYQLIEDKYAGFVDAVHNGQLRLAMEYAVYVIQELNNELFEVQQKVETLESSKSAPAKKASKAKAKLTDDSSDEN